MKSLEAVETEISETYRWFAANAPGVVVKEEGHLARLWAVADAYYAEGES